VVYGRFIGINFQQSDIHFRIGTDEFCFNKIVYCLGDFNFRGIFITWLLVTI
jgi:hypothetical protein